MDYSSELDLANDGFVLTPNVWHSGKGQGKVFEKIVDNARVYYGVDVDGSVVKLDFVAGSAVVAAPTVAADPAVDPAVVEPAAEVSTDVTAED